MRTAWTWTRMWMWIDSDNSPLEQLPQELLERIFEILLMDHIIDQDAQAYYSSLRTLARVSVGWRHLILSTPTLWRVLAVDSNLPKTSTILTNSGKRLSLHVFGSLEKLSEDNSLVQSIPRWEEARLDLRAPVSATGHNLTLRAPLLRKLPLTRVEPMSFESHTSWMVENLFNNDAPMLEDLTLEVISIPWTSHLLTNLSLLSLSKITTDRPTINNILLILRQCPGLLSLCLNYVYILEETPSEMLTGHQTVTHETLQYLGLRRIYPPHALALLLPLVNMPSCQQLELGGCPGEHSEALQQMILKAFGLLRTLLRFPVRFKLKCERYKVQCSAPNNEMTATGTIFRLDINGEAMLQQLVPLSPQFPEAVGCISLHLERIEVPEDCLPTIPNIVSLRLDYITNLAAVIQYLAREEDGFPIPTLETIAIIAPEDHINKETDDALDDTVKLLRLRPNLRVIYLGCTLEAPPVRHSVLYAECKALIREGRISWREGYYFSDDDESVFGD